MNSIATAQGPSVLLQHLANFRLYLLGEGYTPQTIQVYMNRLRALDAAAAAEGVNLNELASRFVHGRPLLVRPGGKAIKVHGFPAFLSFLAKKKLLAPRGFEAQLEHLLSKFALHLKRDVALQPGTIHAHSKVAERFLRHRFKDGDLAPHTITAADVVGFLGIREHRYKYVNVGVKTLLRFLFQAGQIKQPIADGIPHIRSQHKTRLPRFLSSDELEALLARFPVETARDRRNRAMVLMMARMGLRLGEVLRLQSGDIDWATSTVLIRGKRNYLDHMHLPAEVGNALLTYIQHDRPAADCPQVFVRDHAPHIAMPEFSMAALIRGYLKELGIALPAMTGSRVFRHSFATQLVAKGKSITEVAMMLRHRKLGTSLVYARTNLKRLQQVARPWPIAKGRAGR